VTAENGTTKTYTVAVNRASRNSNGGGGGSSSHSTPPTSPSDGTVNSTEGKLTLHAGKTGKVSLGEEVTVSVPPDATDKELIVTIEKVLDTQKLLADKDGLASSIFEILKNFPENFRKPVTLTLSFDPTILKNNQSAAVFYYDEVKNEWVEIGGKMSGHYITVEVDHFT
jgi:tripartite motif-containing protein 71